MATGGCGVNDEGGDTLISTRAEVGRDGPLLGAFPPTALLIPTCFAVFVWRFFFVLSFRASELENKVAAQCLQLHGGAGYLYDTPIARAYLDARVQTIYGGSNEVLKDLIARQILAPARK